MRTRPNSPLCPSAGRAGSGGTSDTRVMFMRRNASSGRVRDEGRFDSLGTWTPLRHAGFPPVSSWASACHPGLPFVILSEAKDLWRSNFQLYYAGGALEISFGYAVSLGDNDNALFFGRRECREPVGTERKCPILTKKMRKAVDVANQILLDIYRIFLSTCDLRGGVPYFHCIVAAGIRFSSASLRIPSSPRPRKIKSDAIRHLRS